MTEKDQSKTPISVGTVVRVGNNGRTGIVRQTRTGPTTVDCLVFFGPNDSVWYPARSLMIVAGTAPIPAWATPERFFRDLAIVKLENKLTDTLFSVQASRTALEPYQFKPVLQFLQLATQRLILADEVGLGKTIEAALILSELRARTDVQRVLIVCPSRLSDKWKGELRQRFDEDFTILNTRSLEAWLDEYVETDGSRPLRGIIPLETLRSERLLDRIEEAAPTFDLAIVDEAHHLRNPDTLQNRAGHVISDHSSAVLLLTATPIQLHSEDLFELLRITDEGQFDSLDTYQQFDEPNHFINAAIGELRKGRPSQAQFRKALEQLKRVERCVLKARFTGSPLYRSVVRRLADNPAPTFADAVTIHRDLRQMNTLSTVMVRTTKRDVKGGAMRAPVVISVPLNEAERAFYDAMLGYVRREYAERGESSAPPGFVLVQRERQAASCLKAAAEVAEELVRFKKVDLEVEDNITELGENGGDNGLLAAAAAREMLEAAGNLGTSDTKYDLFEDALRKLVAETPESKILVFSTFKRTLRYLEMRLRRSMATIGIKRLDGDVPIERRPPIVEEFARAPGFAVLLISEVGSEGLDFQFCDTVFNYDLPWNPMRVEQRIGRLDRYGQKASKVRIYSFVLEKTIEQRILLRLYQRIRIFEESVGDLAPILGQEIPRIEREIFRMDLSEKELEDRTVESLSRIENEMREREEFHKARQALMHQDLMVNKEVEELIDSGRYITPGELKHLVGDFLADRYPGTTLTANDRAGSSYRLAYSPVFRDFILACARRPSVHRDLATSLVKGIESGRPLPVTFTGEVARGRPAIHFLNLRHPITESAVKEALETPRSNVAERLLDLEMADSDPGMAGSYWFFLYKLESEGNEPSRTLTAIVLDEAGQPTVRIETSLMKALAIHANDTSVRSPSLSTRSAPSSEKWSRLEGTAHKRFIEFREATQAKLAERNKALTDARIAALTQTHTIRASRLQRWLREASNTKIRRMREGQITRLQADLRDRIAQLEKGRAVRVGGNLELAGRLTIEYSSTAPSVFVEADANSEVDERVEEARPPETGRSTSTPKDPGKAVIGGTSPDLPNGPDVTAAISLAGWKKLEILDRRERGGVLWIIDPQRTLNLQYHGFTFKQDGTKATGHRSAWYLPRDGASPRIASARTPR